MGKKELNDLLSSGGRGLFFMIISTVLLNLKENPTALGRIEFKRIFFSSRIQFNGLV